VHCRKPCRLCISGAGENIVCEAKKIVMMHAILSIEYRNDLRLSFLSGGGKCVGKFIERMYS
jgi:hypothetical protein